MPMINVTATVTITQEPEALVGLTCQACEVPATTTVELALGTPQQVHSHSRYYVCHAHVLEVAQHQVTVAHQAVGA